jgi:hypothetical protein
MNYGHIVANRRYRMLGTCERCGLVPATDRHHKSGDTYDNERANVAFLCEPCHAEAHRKPPPTHCPQGHDYATHGVINSQGNRICRVCHNQASRASALRRKRAA